MMKNKKCVFYLSLSFTLGNLNFNHLKANRVEKKFLLVHEKKIRVVKKIHLVHEKKVQGGKKTSK